ncbi:MAG: hypothetical protein N838_14480 [Thiohalocapsa sp. PB-PSB1]|nr:MAG: hypothetical protein N838_14480 [Thiohalocapsa sp. PB-PSB1]
MGFCTSLLHRFVQRIHCINVETRDDAPFGMI